MISSRSILSLLAILGVAYAQLATSGYIVYNEFNDVNCTTIRRNTTWIVNACIPTAYLTASYNTATTQVAVTYYNGNNVCDPASAQANPETVNVGACQVYTAGGVSHSYTYYSDFPPIVTNNIATSVYYNSTSSACTGNPIAVVQVFPVCYGNVYGNDNSQIQTCLGTTLTTKSCTDTACSVGCTTATTVVGQTSGCTDNNNHIFSSCNPVSTSGGAATTGSSSPTTTTTTGSSSPTSTTGSSSPTGDAGTTSTGSNPTNGGSPTTPPASTTTSGRTNSASVAGVAWALVFLVVAAAL